MRPEITITPKICFLILASNDSINEQDRLAQELTWCSNLPENISALWVRGSNNSNFIHSGSVLYVPCIEKYENILEKSILAISWAYQNLAFDFLVRTNVSTYFDVQRVQKMLSNRIDEKLFFGGFIDSFKGDFSGQNFPSNRFVSGTGMYFSRDVCPLLIQLNYLEFLGVPDDVAFSQSLISREVYPQFISRGNLHSTHIFLPSAQIRLKSSVASNLAMKRFALVHNFFLSTNLIEKLKSYWAIEKLEIANIRFGIIHLKFYILRNLHIINLNLTLTSKLFNRNCTK